MPIYEPDHVEYSITTGHVQIVLDGGSYLPAYFAHPSLGKKFPGVAIIHDWWGITDTLRRVANLFAQMGHYVMVPDLFNGRVAQNADEAIQLVEALEDHGYPRIHSALGVLETHHQCNRSVAAIGIGMGGSLAFEAAISRKDIEAVVAYGGFPHRYFGRFQNVKIPVCAFFGENEPYIKLPIIEKLRAELALSPANKLHQVKVIPQMGHEFFSPTLNEVQRECSRQALTDTFTFLDQHLERPKQQKRPVY